MPQSPTPNMLLVQPTEGGDDDVWDVLLTAVFALIDAHDHTTSKGVKVPSAGLNINADVAWGTNSITGLKAVDFTPVAASTVAALSGAFFVESADSELYYRTTAGVNVKVTDGAALNVGAFTGGIGGDYAAIGALVDYTDATKYYRFRQEDDGGRDWAGIAGGSVDIYELSSLATFRVRLQSPAALAANYALTLPPAVAAGFLQSTAGGVTSLSYTLPTNQNITVVGTGDYAHGDKTFSQSCHPVAQGSLTITFPGDVVTYDLAGANAMYIELRLRTGDRLKSIQLWGSSAAEPTMTVLAYRTDGVVATQAITTSNTIVANQKKTATLDTPYTLAAPGAGGGTTVMLKVLAGASAATLFGIDVTYDHP